MSSIEIPSSVTSIGFSAFSGCSGLESITVESENSRYDSRENCNAIIEKESNILVTGCKNTKISDSVKGIGNNAFYGCSGLSGIEIPDSVTSIGADAFHKCSSLTSIKIPSSVTSIDTYAFDMCENFKTVYANKNSYAADWAKKQGYTVILINNNATDKQEDSKPSDNTNKPQDTNSTDNTNKTPSGTNTTPDNTSTAVPNVNNESPVTACISKGTKFAIPDGKCQVKVISDDAKNPTVVYVKSTNTKATSVKVPDTVKYNNITYTVTGIADKAFSGNKKLKSVTIGKNVASIGKEAFRNCKNLNKITLKSTKLTKNSIGKNALKGTNKNLVIKVPKSKVKDYQKYFKNKGNTKVKVKK